MTNSYYKRCKLSTFPPQIYPDMVTFAKSPRFKDAMATSRTRIPAPKKVTLRTPSSQANTSFQKSAKRQETIIPKSPDIFVSSPVLDSSDDAGHTPHPIRSVLSKLFLLLIVQTKNSVLDKTDILNSLEKAELLLEEISKEIQLIRKALLE